jgi:hypothetical protein
MLERQYKGDSSACHPCREYFVLTAGTFRSYCCLLLPRGFRKSCGVNEKAGRAVGIELKATLNARKLLISLNGKNAKNS